MDSALRNDKGENVTLPEQKLELFASYYSELYSSAHLPEEKYTVSCDTATLPSPTVDLVYVLNVPITLLEIENAIMSL